MRRDKDKKHLLLLGYNLHALQDRARDLGVQVLSHGRAVQRRLGLHGEARVRVCAGGSRRARGLLLLDAVGRAGGRSGAVGRGRCALLDGGRLER